jgi:hypothetical protein
MPNIIGQRIKGNIAYLDRAAHLRRLVDAIGPDVIKYEALPWHAQATGGTGTQPQGWTTTLVEAGAGESDIEASDEAGAVWEIVTDAAENDGVNAQLNGEAFELTADQHLYFGTCLKADDATQSDFFVGLAIVDTDILGGVTDRIGFEKLDGSTDIKFMVEKDSTETLSAALATFANNTYVTLEFYWDGPANALYVFVNGVQQAAPALTNLPNDEALRLSLQFLAGAAAAKRMTIQWLRIIQIGR